LGEVKLPLHVEIMGEPEVGKTHLGCLFPAPAIIDTTAKREALPIAMKLLPDWAERYFKVYSLEDIREALRHIEKKNGEEPGFVKTIVIDTSADLQRLAAEEWIREHGKKQVFPVTQYAHVRSKIDELIHKVLDGLKLNLVFISQMKDEYAGGEKTGRRVRDGYKKTPFQADIRLYLYFEKGEEGKIVSRKAQVVKNRFVDPLAEGNPRVIGDPDWGAIRELVLSGGYPEEVLVE